MTHRSELKATEPSKPCTSQPVPCPTKVQKTAPSWIRKLVPAQIRQRVLSVSAWGRTVGVVSDFESFRQYRRLENTTTRWPHNAGEVRIRLRPLGGAAVSLRPRTADRYALRATFSDVYHRPPAQLPPESIRVIWDLGANIGLTMADLAYHYPAAQIVGVELDAVNAALCRRNVAPWADRCQLHEGAVWCEDGEIEYRRDAGMEQGFRVGPVAEVPANARTRSVSLNTLLAHTPGARVDFAKIDIEGAERDVLRRNTEWAAGVRSIKVEIHEPYSVAECVCDLGRLGFAAAIDAQHPACVIGLRESELDQATKASRPRSRASSATSVAGSRGTRSLAAGQASDQATPANDSPQSPLDPRRGSPPRHRC